MSRILILALGLVAISAFTVYTFSDSSFGVFNSQPKTGEKVTPTKTSPTLATDANNNSNNPSQAASSLKSKQLTTTTSATVNTYENRDKPENYYSIKFPSYVTVSHTDKLGGYEAKLKDGSHFSVGLVDIPDNTNVQLFALTHEEPHLNSSLKDYHKVSFSQRSLGGGGSNNSNSGSGDGVGGGGGGGVVSYSAWDLVYTWTNATGKVASVQSYNEGQDNAVLIEYAAPIQQFEANNSTVMDVLDSFRWIG